MNNKLKKVFANLSGRNGAKNLVITIVILVEILAIMVVATFAWVETVSSIKIKTNANEPLEVDSYYFTEAMIGGSQGTIDMGKYFKPAGDMHFAPCSSVDGDSFFFPKKSGSTAFLGTGANNFRKGNSSDKNTAYMSVTFKLKADENADFFFTQVPSFSAQGTNMRVSVTAYTEGTSKGDLYDSNGKPKYTKVYASSASTAPVVGNTSGGTSATAVEAFSNHIKGLSTDKRLFAVGANETKIVTINVWLQGTTSSSNLAQNIAISNFGITSSLTPRMVTLYPTSIWSADNPTFYAWCYKSGGSRLYKLEVGSDGHYTFEYNGTYDHLVFVRAKTNCSVNSGTYTSWPFSNNSNDPNAMWNQTEDLNIPSSPPEDPSYFIRSMTGGTDGKSNGYWNDPATIKLAYADGSSSACGSLEGTSYLTNTSSAVVETAKSSGGTHTDTLHVRTSQNFQLKATANTDYAFVGWFTDAAATTAASGSSTSTTYTATAPSTATEVTYYAKFKEVRTITLAKRLDGSDSSSSACGTLYVDIHPTINNSTESSTGGSVSKIVDKDSTVKLWAVANNGYTLAGIFTTSSGTTPASSNTITEGGITKYLVTANNNTTYYARFTTNSYSVTAYSSTGGKVSVNNQTPNATSSTASIKHNASVSISATANSGYEFAGWYTAATGGTLVNSNSTFSYTVNAANYTVYARFNAQSWAIKYGESGGSNWSTANMTVSNNIATGTITLTEGQDFSFKITKTVNSTTTWYGGGGSYSDITSTSFISNLSMSTSGADTYMKGHAGTYSFSYNLSTGKLNVTASYSNITLTLYDDTNGQWLKNDSCKLYFKTDEGTSNAMSRSGNAWTVSMPSNYCTNPQVLRKSSDGNTTHNTWNCSNRGYITECKITDSGFSWRDW